MSGHTRRRHDAGAEPVSRLARLWHEKERGESVIELVIAVPVLLLLVFTIVQFTLVWHAEQVAQAAASQALAAARVQGGTQAAGQAHAEQILNQVAGATLPTSSVSVQVGADQAEVEVSGTAQSILPFFTLHVHAEAAGPVERTSTP